MENSLSWASSDKKSLHHKSIWDGMISAFLCQQHGTKHYFLCKALSLLLCTPPTIHSTTASAKGAQSSPAAGNHNPTLRKVRFCRWNGRPGKPSRVGFKETPTGGGPRRECLVAWGKNCCSAGAVMLNPRRFPKNANTAFHHPVLCKGERKIFHLNKQQVEGKGSSTHDPVLYWALHRCSVLYPLQHTEWFDVIATITMAQAI